MFFKGLIKDILSEIKTLKFELLKNEEKNYEYEPFLKVIRYLLEEQNNHMRTLIIFIFENLEEGVVNILKHNSFEELYKIAGYSIELANVSDLVKHKNTRYELDMAFTTEIKANNEDAESITVTLGVQSSDKILVTNAISLKAFEDTYEKLKLLAIGSHKIRMPN